MSGAKPAELWHAILAKLDRGDCPDNKWPDAKGEYWALCPFHADTHSGNFSVCEHGFKCFACGEKGGLHNLAAKLGVAVLQCCSGGYISPCSLADYARAKHLPSDFLMTLGLKDVKWQDGSVRIRIPYYDQTGREVTYRFRIAMSGDKFRWAKGSRVMLYGLWRLDPAARSVIFVEGESDCHTLWHYGLPALGVPGAATWKPEWARFVDGLTVYVWREPDQGGNAFLAAVGKSLPDCLVLTAPAGRKDISECQVAGEDVPALVADMMAHAQPYQAVHARAVSVEAAGARRAAGSLLKSPDILAEFVQLCQAQGLVGEQKIAKLLYLAVTSRLLAKPVSVVLKGPSAGGKSLTVETVLKAFPSSAFYALSSMSERALAYSQEPLQHRMLVLYEAAGLASDFGSYLMRTLLSEGCIRYETVEKTIEGLKPKLIEREGPTGLLVTTTSAGLHPENETRMFSVTVQDDRKQTQGVLLSLADRVNGHKAAVPDLTPWHALQTWLEVAGVREVTIPYAHELAQLADARAVRLRRDFGAVLNLIATHGMLHQETRGKDASGRIVADITDYRAVYDVVIDWINQGVQATVSAAVRETVQAVKELDPLDAGVSVSRVAERLQIDKSSASRRVRVALDEGYLANQNAGRKGYPYKLTLGDALPAESNVLPRPEELENMCSYIPRCNTATLQHSGLADYELSLLAEAEAM